MKLYEKVIDSRIRSECSLSNIVVDSMWFIYSEPMPETGLLKNIVQKVDRYTSHPWTWKGHLIEYREIRFGEDYVRKISRNDHITS